MNGRDWAKAQLCDLIGQCGHWPSLRRRMEEQLVQIERWHFVLYKTLAGNWMFIGIITVGLMLFYNFC